MVVGITIVSYLAFTIKALMVYENIWILAYTILIGVLLSSVLITIKPFTAMKQPDEYIEE